MGNSNSIAADEIVEDIRDGIFKYLKLDKDDDRLWNNTLNDAVTNKCTLINLYTEEEINSNIYPIGINSIYGVIRNYLKKHIVKYLTINILYF